MAAVRLIATYLNKGKTPAQWLTELTDSRLPDSVKEDGKRLQEIAVPRKHINNYSKARNTFAEYKASGYNQTYFENHRELLTARREASCVSRFTAARHILRTAG